MGNYKPANINAVWADVRIGVMDYFEKRVIYADREFPLTHQEMQLIVMQPDTLEVIDNLKRYHSVTNIPTYDSFYWKIEEKLEQVPRPAIMRCSVKPGIHLPHTTYSSHPVSVVIQRLPEERQALVFKWINNSVLERRHRDLARHFIQEFLDRTPSLWHLMVRWPSLQLGFDNDLKKRAYSKPRFPRQYGWEHVKGKSKCDDYAWYLNNKKFMDFVDTLLLDASLMPPLAPRGDPPVSAEVASWTKLGDERF